MGGDLLGESVWECAPAPAGEHAGPDALDGVDPAAWLSATVPGTAASALRDADGAGSALGRDLDGEDWWFRTRFVADGAGPWLLRLDGLATLCQVWLNGELLLESRSMFRSHLLQVAHLRAQNDLVVCARALAPHLRDRRPRARWRTRLVSQQGLRRWRTSLAGRMPSWYGLAPVVGPWRPVSLRPAAAWWVADSAVRTSVAGTTGVVHLDLAVGGAPPGSVTVRVDGDPHLVAVTDGRARADLVVEDVSLWWPHGYGAAPLSTVEIDAPDGREPLGRVGFRTVTVDRDDHGFTLAVNGVRIFARGSCWVPPDPLTLSGEPDRVRHQLGLLREAGHSMVRVTGTLVWEDPWFWRCCDELGLLVWQDCMVATLDLPDEDDFVDELAGEVTEQLTRLAGHPALAVVSGGSETEQQVTMAGLPASARSIPAIEDLIPGILARVAPGVPYVSSTPTGGPLPTHVSTGIAHYFGVGAYLRPLDDVRQAGVRFAAEALAFSVPPERAAVEEWFGSAAVAGHHPDWKRAVPRDNAASWDFEDVSLHYLREVFGVEPFSVRLSDPERMLDLERAAVAHVMATTMGWWRAPSSRCGGALILQSRDLVPGAGWGLLDAAGRPKAPWYSLRRVLAPRAVWVSDEGLDGLAIHLANDPDQPWTGTVSVEFVDRQGRLRPMGEREVLVAARTTLAVSVDELVGSFTDVNQAFRFGTAQFEAVRVVVAPSGSGETVEHVHLVDQSDVRPDPDLGLRAEARARADGDWEVLLGTRRTARWVSLDVPGFAPDDSWFHLLPGVDRTVVLRRGGPDADVAPRGTIRAVNGLGSVPLQTDSS